MNLARVCKMDETEDERRGRDFSLAAERDQRELS